MGKMTAIGAALALASSVALAQHGPGSAPGMMGAAVTAPG